MTLRELNAKFLKRENDRSFWCREDMTDAKDGLMFLCPVCFVTNKGPIGTHSVICWFIGRVPDTELPGPGRWAPVGTTLDDLTLRAGSSSVLLSSDCKAHFFVENGKIRMC